MGWTEGWYNARRPRWGVGLCCPTRSGGLTASTNGHTGVWGLPQGRCVSLADSCDQIDRGALSAYNWQRLARRRAYFNV